MIEQIHIDFQKKEPIYFQIEEQLKVMITSGEIMPGEQLPTVRELAEALEVNFNTIARVYRLLDRQGFVSTQHGRGCYVLPQALPPDEQKQKMLEELTENYLLECRHLGFSTDAIIRQVQNKLQKEI